MFTIVEANLDKLIWLQRDSGVDTLIIKAKDGPDYYFFLVQSLRVSNKLTQQQANNFDFDVFENREGN